MKAEYVLYAFVACGLVWLCATAAAHGWFRVKARYQARFVRSIMKTGDDGNGE